LVVNHCRHLGLLRHLVSLRRGADAEGHALQRFLLGYLAELLVQSLGVAAEDEEDAKMPALSQLAGRLV
jgi:hypothetical protein